MNFSKIVFAIALIDDSQTKTYKHTTNPGAQCYPKAGFGMFIHWSIASVNELDLSWPMMAGTQIGWNSNKPAQNSINKYNTKSDFFASHRYKKDTLQSKCLQKFAPSMEMYWM